MANTIITPEFRATFISVFKPSKPKSAKPDQQPKFSVRAAFPPDTDLSAMKKMAEETASNWTWKGGSIPKNLRSPFRLNEELDDPIPGIGDDWTVMTFSSPQDKKPGIVDANLQDIIDDSEVYSGAWFRVQVDCYGYEQQGNKGVTFGLKNVQKVRDQRPDEADIGGGSGRMPASKAFEAFGGGGGKSASGLFD